MSGKKQVLIARLEKASARESIADANDSNDSNCSSRDMEASIRVSRSVYGNYTYEDLVIDRDTGVCVGYKKLGGTDLPLTAQHIEKCLQYRLEYRMPHNLDEGDEGDDGDENDHDGNDENDDEEENDDDEVEVEVEVEMTDDEIIEEYEYDEEVEEEVEEVEEEVDTTA